MTIMRHVARLALGAFFMLHGFAHSPGILGTWKLKTFEDVSYRPNVLLDNASNTTVSLLGIIWLFAALAFLYAGYEVIRGAQGWTHVMLFATVVSLAVSLLWYKDAIIGVVIDVGILVAYAAYTVWAERHHHTHISLPSHA
jgi:hypothetical protein